MRALRFLGKAVTVAVALAVVLLAVAYGLLRSGLITDHVDAIITLLARKPGIFFVRAEDVSGDLPFHLKVKKVEIGDHWGVWLTIEDAEATWHPFDLFHPFDHVKWRVVVDDIHAAHVAWTRLPRDAPDEPDEPFHWDRFVRLVVGHLLVDDFELSDRILDGSREHLRAEGSGVLGEWDHGFVKLDIEHLEPGEGRATIDLATHGSPLELTGTVVAEEADGGALAELARLPDAGAVRLSVRAGGPMKDWHGDAEVTASNIGVLKASAHLAFTPDGPFDVTGTFDPVAAERERYLVGEGGPIDVAAAGAWAPGVELRLDRVRLVADSRELAAHGRLDLATKRFEVSGALSHLAGGQDVHLTLLDARRATLEGRGVLGDAGRVEATLDVDGPTRAGVLARTFHADFHAQDAPGPSVPTFTLEAVAKGLTGGDGPLPLFGDAATLSASGRIELIEGLLAADRLHVAGEAVTIDGPLAFSEKWKTMTASLQADAPSLSSLERSVRTSVAGTATAKLDLVAKSGWQDLDAKLTATAGDLRVGERGWDALLGPTATLEASLRGAPSGPARGELSLETAGIDASARGEVGAGGKGLVVDAKVAVDNLSRLAEPARAAIAGKLDATASARGDLDRFGVDLAVRGERVRYEGVRFDRLSADAGGEGFPGAWKAGVHLRGSYGKQDAMLDAEVSRPADGRLLVRDLVLKGPRTDGRATVDVDLGSGLASGNVSLKSGDLAAWRPMTGVAIGGSLDLDATLAVPPAAKGSRPAQLVGGSVSMKNAALSVGATDLFVAGLEASADGLEVGPSPKGGARLRVSRARYGGTTVRECSATVQGDGKAWNVEAKLDAKDGESFLLDAAGAVTPGRATDIVLARLAGSVGDTPLSLAQPARVRLEDGGAPAWSVDGLDLAVGSDGRVSGQASRKGGATTVRAEATRLPLELVSTFVPALDLGGTIDGSVSFDGASLAGGTGALSLRGHDIASTGLEHEGVEPVDLLADFRLARGRAAGKASVAGLRDTRLELDLDAPLANASASDPVVIDLVWKGEVASAAALIPMGEDTLKGHVDADVRLSGTVASPRVSGRAVLDGGTWENEVSGLVLKDIHAELEGTGTTLELRRLAATDGDGGTVSATGQVRFGQFPMWEAQVDLDAVGAMLARLDLVTAKADAKLALRAARGPDPGVTGSISGSIRILDARVNIPQRFVSDVPEIHVTEIGDDGQPEEGGEDRGRVVLGLDVAVIGDNRIFLNGRGVESEWSSDVHVRGDTADPRVEGVITSVRGQMSLLGRRFDVTSATIRFTGDSGNVPYLALSARAEANNVTAIVDVTGPALHPTIDLRSEPALPRDEVLSRILFGQSAATLTPMQSVQLAQGLAELTGAPILGGGGTLLTGVGQTLGFDRLEVGSAGSSGGAALMASKYLTDSVYLRVQQGLTPEDSKLAIEWKVLKHVTIESDVSQDAQGEVGATWRWDY